MDTHSRRTRTESVGACSQREKWCEARRREVPLAVHPKLGHVDISAAALSFEAMRAQGRLDGAGRIQRVLQAQRRRNAALVRCGEGGPA